MRYGIELLCIILALCGLGACRDDSGESSFSLANATQPQLDRLYEVALAGAEACKANCEWELDCDPEIQSCDSCRVIQDYYQKGSLFFNRDLEAYQAAPEQQREYTDCSASVQINHQNEVIAHQQAIAECYGSAPECTTVEEDPCLQTVNRGGEIFGPCYPVWEQATEYCEVVSDRVRECGLDTAALWLDSTGECGVRHSIYFFDNFTCYWSRTDPEKVERWETLFEDMLEEKIACHKKLSCEEIQTTYADAENLKPVCPYSSELASEFSTLAQECPSGTIAIEDALNNFPTGSISKVTFYPPVFVKRRP